MVELSTLISWGIPITMVIVVVLILWIYWCWDREVPEDEAEPKVEEKRFCKDCKHVEKGSLYLWCKAIHTSYANSSPYGLCCSLNGSGLCKKFEKKEGESDG